MNEPIKSKKFIIRTKKMAAQSDPSAAETSPENIAPPVEEQAVPAPVMPSVKIPGLSQTGQIPVKPIVLTIPGAPKTPAVVSGSVEPQISGSEPADDSGTVVETKPPRPAVPLKPIILSVAKPGENQDKRVEVETADSAHPPVVPEASVSSPEPAPAQGVSASQSASGTQAVAKKVFTIKAKKPAVSGVAAPGVVESAKAPEPVPAPPVPEPTPVQSVSEPTPESPAQEPAPVQAVSAPQSAAGAQAVAKKVFTIKAKKPAVSGVSAPDVVESAKAPEPAPVQAISEPTTESPEPVEQPAQTEAMEAEDAEVVKGPAARGKLSLKKSNEPSPASGEQHDAPSVNKARPPSVRLSKRMGRVPSAKLPSVSEQGDGNGTPAPEAIVDLADVRARSLTVKEKGKTSTVIAFCLGGVLLAAAVAGLWWMMRGVTAGRVILAQGDVQLYRAPKEGSGKVSQYLPATLKMRVVSNDFIQTGSNGIARLFLAGMQELKLEPNTLVQVGITKLGTFKKGGFFVNIYSNTAYLEIPRQPAGKPLVLTLPDSVVTIQEARLGVTHAQNRTIVRVVSGSVTVTRNLDRQSREIVKDCEITLAEGIQFEPRLISGETRVESLSLVDGGTGEVVPGYEVLKSELVLKLGSIPAASFGIRANTMPGVVGSVKFIVKESGLSFVCNEDPPYIFTGQQKSGTGKGWAPSSGNTYTIEAVSYTKKDAKGQPSIPRRVQFNVIK